MQTENYFLKYGGLRHLIVSEKCDGKKEPYKMQEWMWLFSQWIVKLRKLEMELEIRKEAYRILFCIPLIFFYGKKHHILRSFIPRIYLYFTFPPVF